jgi:hypothetical protein
LRAHKLTIRVFRVVVVVFFVVVVMHRLVVLSTLFHYARAAEAK